MVINISVERLIIGMWPEVGINTFADVLINMLSSVAVGLGIGMPVVVIGMPVLVVVASAAIALEFAVSVSYPVDLLLGVRLDALTTVYSGVKCVTASAIGVDTLAKVMADSKYIVPPLSANPVYCC